MTTEITTRERQIHTCVIKNNDTIANVAKEFGLAPSSIRRACDKVTDYDRERNAKIKRQERDVKDLIKSIDAAYNALTDDIRASIRQAGELRQLSFRLQRVKEGVSFSQLCRVEKIETVTKIAEKILINVKDIHLESY